LKEQGKIYNKIFISDLADVIFQADPFGFDIKYGLYPACEQNRFGDDTHAGYINMSWIDEYSHLEGLNKSNFKNKNIICCGTILGYYDNIMDYLEYYYRINHKQMGNDQALINMYLYNDNKHIVIADYTTSRILTLDGMQFDRLSLNENGKIVNKKNELYCIIHQINRCNLGYMLSIVDNM
jgi:hypothetical protein